MVCQKYNRQQEGVGEDIPSFLVARTGGLRRTVWVVRAVLVGRAALKPQSLQQRAVAAPCRMGGGEQAVAGED